MPLSSDDQSSATLRSACSGLCHWMQTRTPHQRQASQRGNKALMFDGDTLTSYRVGIQVISGWSLAVKISCRFGCDRHAGRTASAEKLAAPRAVGLPLLRNIETQPSRSIGLEAIEPPLDRRQPYAERLEPELELGLHAAAARDCAARQTGIRHLHGATSRETPSHPPNPCSSGE